MSKTFMSKTVGEFHVSVEEPYPSFVTVSRDGKAIRFDHKELRDFQHALEEARRSVYGRLDPTRRWEAER